MTQPSVIADEEPSPDPRVAAAARLGAERRRVFLLASLAAIVTPSLGYLAGTWEAAWYLLASTWWPLPLRAALFLLALHLVLAFVAVPFAFYGGFILPRAFGLSRQRFRGWVRDWLLSVLLGAIMGTLAGGALLWSTTRLGSHWWWAFGLVATAAIPLVGFLVPYLVVPLFFRQQPLSDEGMGARVRALLARAGAEVREVCSLDSSRRTAEANAAVIGMGRSRRVVIADTLLAEFQPAEVEAVVAHEIGHHVRRDVPRLLAIHLALTWAGILLAALVAPRALPLLGIPHLAYVPAYPVLLSAAELFFLLAAPLTNWWSRRLEANADRFALRLTSDPAAFAAAMRRLAAQNLVELRPPRWAEVLFGTHPALYRRIALAEEWAA